LAQLNKQARIYCRPKRVLVEEYSVARIEDYFDRGAGACSLRDPRVGELVADALRFWNGKLYRLVAWCVLPNHVHVVCRLLPGAELAKVLQSWKSYTARRANAILGRKGTFWQREYYDRLIRDEEEFERAVRYVVSNPERAGLKDRKWVWCAAGEEARATAGLETGATSL
jgi:REP element-mobilizing transposase RayT